MKAEIKNSADVVIVGAGAAGLFAALSLAPQDSEIRHNWGWYLCNTGKPKEAIVEFDIALRNPLFPRVPLAFYQHDGAPALVLLCVKSGDTADAAHQLKTPLAVMRAQLETALAEDAAAGVAPLPQKKSPTTSPGSLNALMSRVRSASGFWASCGCSAPG